MKNITLLIMGVILAISSGNGQQQKDNTNYLASLVKTSYHITKAGVYYDSLTKEGYLTKSKNQKTTAWVLLGGGIVLGTVGGIILSQNTFHPLGGDNSGFAGGSVLLTVGVLSTLGSILFFISSSHNARRAAEISFKNQEISIPHSNNVFAKTQPAFTLKINL
jgi:hypothetical protein